MLRIETPHIKGFRDISKKSYSINFKNNSELHNDLSNHLELNIIYIQGIHLKLNVFYIF